MNYRSSKPKAQSSKNAPPDNDVGGVAGNRLDDSFGESKAGGLMALREDAVPVNGRPPGDLLERTAVFGENIVRFSKKVPHNPGNDRLIGQLVGAGTSVGANYCEANEAESKKDFRHIVTRCAKEAKETKFFLRMIAAAEPVLAPEARSLYREAHELLLIFGSMRHK